MWGAQVLRYYGGHVIAPRLSPGGRYRVVILVHGFNNDKAEAEENYRSLIDNLPATERSIVNDTWQFFWPSFVGERFPPASRGGIDAPHDERGAHSNRVLTLPTYPHQVTKAKKVGEALGRFCGRLGSTQVVFVAHSLGCRLVLEALQAWIAGRGRELPPDCHVACLMAAAVPVRRVGRGRDLHAAATSTRSYVLYSPRDMVLQTAFRAGESGPFQGLAPQAVGTWGRPYDVWPRRGNTKLGHSQYWGNRGTAPAVLRAVNRVTERELESVSPDVEWTLPTSTLTRSRGLPASRLAAVWRWF